MKKQVYIVILLWVLLTGGITAYNERILHCGKEILLKISPVDPRDFLRGDYVHLMYDINRIPDFAESRDDLHEDVYVILHENPDKTYSIENLSDKKPEGDCVFIKGKKSAGWIYYDEIQQYFVKEGEGIILEQKLRNGGVARVSVYKNGRARIKGIFAG